MALRPLVLSLSLLVAATPAWAEDAAPRRTVKARVGDFLMRELNVGAPTVPKKGEPRVALWKGSLTQYALIAPYVAMQTFAAHEAFQGALHGPLWHVPLVLGAAKLGLAAADGLGGFFHWGPDNYFKPETPVAGPYVKNFLEHHDPRTMRAAANASIPNLMIPYIPVGYLPLLSTIALAPHDPFAMAFAATFALAPYSLVAHAEAHKSPSEQGPVERRVVNGLRKMKLLVTSKEHLGGHHGRDHGHAGGYAALTGETNAVFDKHGVYRKAEALVFATTGAIPRDWEDEHAGAATMHAALDKHPRLLAKAIARMK